MTKTILITGASSGIGKAAARLFAQRDWQVVATMRNPEDGSGLEGENVLVIRPIRMMTKVRTDLMDSSAWIDRADSKRSQLRGHLAMR